MFVVPATRSRGVAESGGIEPLESTGSSLSTPVARAPDFDPLVATISSVKRPARAATLVFAVEPAGGAAQVETADWGAGEEVCCTPAGEPTWLFAAQPMLAAAASIVVPARRIFIGG
jgi:hypothetical protein